MEVDGTLSDAGFPGPRRWRIVYTLARGPGVELQLDRLGCLEKTRTELRDKKLVALHGHERRLQRGPAQERQGYRRKGDLRRRRVGQVRPADDQ